MKGHRAANGLTLIEMLVVFVFMALLSVLVVQGLAFFMGNYQSVARAVQDADSAARQRVWFETTVQGMVASRHPARRFMGTAQSFEGQTLQPLSAESGVPIHIRWALGEADSGAVLTYQEAASDVSWTVLTQDPRAGGSRASVARRGTARTDAPHLAFQYADRVGNWLPQWPPREFLDDEYLPRAVRLVSAEQQTVWLVQLDLHFQPIIQDEDYFLTGDGQ